MQQLFFGLSLFYGPGNTPAVAINRQGVVLEVHRNEMGTTLYYRVGTLSQAAIVWGPSRNYTQGINPNVALNGNNLAFEVHESQSRNTLWLTIWRVAGDAVTRLHAGHYDDGVQPTIAMNDAGIAVGVHKAYGSFQLWYQVWRVGAGGQMVRLHKQKLTQGENPSVAINNRGQVVGVHTYQSKLCYVIGGFNGTSVAWGASRLVGGTGSAPSVALTDDGLVILAYKSSGGLFQRTGVLSPNDIAWSDPIKYDQGGGPSVAVAGETAVAVNFMNMKTWYSTSLITDRARWMQNNMATLGGRRLGDLVLPASHDAAMYVRNITSPWTKTQDLTIYGQLRWGLRYFDLRPMWTGRKFVMHHGRWHGPDLSEVLADIRKFALEGHRELVILKFSHFEDINDATYARLVDEIDASIGPWLVRSTPKRVRLADVTLGEYVANGRPAFVVVVDKHYAVTPRRHGFWVYRNWNADLPGQGDLNVDDRWSNTESLTTMRNGQFGNFAGFDGRMEKDRNVPCDLFLLSWTLTPKPPIPTPVWELAKVANPPLGHYVQIGQNPNPIPNRFGKFVGLLSLDYVEFARVTDVAIHHNRLRATAAKPKRTPARRKSLPKRKSRPKRKTG
jgi:hypothetical protein